MNEKEAASLIALLNELVLGPFDNDTSTNHDLYSQLRDSLRTDGIAGLRTMLEQRLLAEDKFGFDLETDYAVVYKILFGDIGDTPPYINRFRRLCIWRLDQG